MKKKIVFLITLTFLIAGCNKVNSKENQLKHRVNKYYMHLIKGELNLSWDLLMRNSKDRWNRDEWTIFAQRFFINRKIIKIKIKSILIFEVNKIVLGKVKVFGKYDNLKVKKTEKYEEEELWVFENGEWFKCVD